jgi:hypothetical protein
MGTILPGPATKHPLSKTLQYLYFMRFSLLLWGFLILLPVFDLGGISTSITRGMFALELKQALLFSWPADRFWNVGQFIWVAFYVVLCGWIALLSARVVCAYGEERFATAPPAWLQVHSTTGGSRGFLLAFLGSQVPGLWFLIYTAKASIGESSPKHPLGWWPPVIGFGFGFVFAFLAWFLTEIFYRLARKPLGPTSRFFLMPLPPWQFLQRALNSTPNPSWASRLVEGMLRLIARIGGPGYKRPGTPSEINSGIAFGVLLFGFLLLIYALLGYLTRPITWRAVWEDSPAVFILWTFLAIALVFPAASLLYAQVFRVRNAPSGAPANERGYWIWWIVAEFLAGVLFTALVWKAFPVLAAILVLALSLCWAGSGLAFFFDRWRIPVVTAAAAILVILFWWPFSLDHFYPTLRRSGAKADAPTPEDVINKFRGLVKNEPLIIVTASGGGIHSAVWTATVLNQLEKAFDRNHESFHRHVMLMSSVSGGSVAVSYWAENYLDAAAASPVPFDPNASERAAMHSTCSSLESAAWGLLFPDLSHLLVWKDVAAWLFPGLRTWDRGWALETAFERNREPGCEWPNGESWLKHPIKWLDAAQVPHPERYTLTLLRDKLKDPAADMPAFAFNSVEVSDGRRFLLSNYTVPEFSPAPCDFGLQPGKSGCPPSPQPARSFLNVCPDLDISLFTAARLSATFPYATPVSVANLPEGLSDSQKKANSFCFEQHLADGGYYDNDGMASAMEFLWSGLGYMESQLPELKAGAAPTEKAATAPDNGTQPENPCPRLNTVPCFIVIEIRNSEEPSDEMPKASQPALGHVIEQLFAPPGAVLGAWNVAQSYRNQQEYRILQFALRDKVDFSHFVFSFGDAAGACEKPGQGLPMTNPESWHLTPWAKENIQCTWANVYQRQADQLAAAFHASHQNHP